MTEDEFRSGGQPRSHGISEAYRDVHQFHRVFSHPANFTPVMQPEPKVEARCDWILEEINELSDAKTIYDQADAYIDIIYFAIGGLVEMGVDPGPIWQIVQHANMAKVQPDGSVKRRDDGKIIKPEGWQAPDEAIAEEINRQIDAGNAPLFEMGDPATMHRQLGEIGARMGTGNGESARDMVDRVQGRVRIPAGMKPWHGGDTAPSDWDGVGFAHRDGEIYRGRAAVSEWIYAVGHDILWTHSNSAGDIIAYTAKA